MLFCDHLGLFWKEVSCCSITKTLFLINISGKTVEKVKPNAYFVKHFYSKRLVRNLTLPML